MKRMNFYRAGYAGHDPVCEINQLRRFRDLVQEHSVYFFLTFSRINSANSIWDNALAAKFTMPVKCDPSVSVQDRVFFTIP